MNAATTRCPECNGEMVQGFIVDRGHGKSTRVSDWVEGAPEKSVFSGVSAPGDKRIPVGAFRCSGCGFLKFYARPEFAAEWPHFPTP